MKNKQVILNIEAVYTANAFGVGSEFYIGAGSETKPEVYLYNITTGKTSQVKGSPGGVMSFLPGAGQSGSVCQHHGIVPTVYWWGSRNFFA